MCVNARLREQGDNLLGGGRVHRGRKHVEAHAVDAARVVHALLERLDGARCGARGRADRALRVLYREPELCLCTLVDRGGGGTDGERDASLLCEVRGEELDELVVDCSCADSVRV